MLLRGYFHTESSHHASEYWAWFRRTPELVEEYLDRRWDYLDVSRSSDASESNAEIVAGAKASGIRHGGEVAAPLIRRTLPGRKHGGYREPRDRGILHNPVDRASGR